MNTQNAPFTNCSGDATYDLIVSNSSVTSGTGNIYTIDWGDNTAPFTQTDWPANAQISHNYASQGYFSIVISITATSGCTKSVAYQFYNGQNPLASFSTTSPTTGLCAPASVEFQIGGNWFKNSPGTIYVVDFGDGSPLYTLSHPLNPTNTVRLLTHQYTTSSCPSIDFTATLKVINGCFITTYTLNQIIIRTKPKADFSVNPIKPCINVPVCFTNLTTDGYSGNNNCSSASNFTWDFGDGTTSNEKNPPCHTYTVAKTYTVTLTASNATCGSDVITKQVVVSPTSPPPVPGPRVVYCQGQPAVPLTATGTGLLWYTTATGGSGSTVAPTPSTNRPGTVTYYVSQTVTDKCESPRVPVTVTVNALPPIPVVTSPVQLCQNQVAPPLTATGSGLLWYTSATGGIGSSVAPTPLTATIGNTTYYVSQTTNDCEGPRAAILVTVNPLAGAPVVMSPIIYCQHQPAVPLTATGSGLLWYTTATGGTGSSVAPTPSTATADNATYYVSQVTGCGEGPRVPITVHVNAAPSASIVYQPASLCNAASTLTTPNLPVPVTHTGTPGGTYSISPATGLPINATTGEINPAGATAGTYTIRYTVPASGGCPDYSVTATVTVSSTPTAAITYRDICTSDAATLVNLTGVSGGTFTSTAGLTINQATGTITPGTSTPGTYTVTYTIAAAPPCGGFITSTNVTVSKAPLASIAYQPASLCNAASTLTTPNLPVPVTHTGTPGGRYSISPATGLPINATTGEIDPVGATAGTYTIRYTVPASGGCRDYSVTATVTVSNTPTASIAYPAICTSDAATLVNLTGVSGGTFTSTAGLIIDQATGTITPGTSTPGTYTVTYTIAAAPPCDGFITHTNVTVSKAPSASITYQPASLCNVVNTVSTPNLPVPVIHTGTGNGSYSITPVTGLSINTITGEINPSGATAGVYTIKYTIPGAGGCANYSTTTTVSVNSTPVATITYPGSPYCGGNTAAQPVSLSGTPGGTFSAGQGLSVNAATGEINPGLSTPGVYTVTYTIAAVSPCPGYVTTTDVEITESPVLTFPIATQSICSGDMAVFRPSSTVANTTYTWAVVGSLPANVAGVSSGSLSGPNPAISLSFTNTGTVSQSLTVRVIPVNPAQNPCTGVPYDLTLVVKPITPAPVTVNADFCMGMPPAALSINPLPGTTVKWYDKDGVLINGAPVINTNVAGRFVYNVSQTNSYGCESPKSGIVAIVHPTAKIISAAYTDPVNCGIPSGAITLNVLDLNNGALPNVPVTVYYNKFQTAYTFSTNTDASGKITVPLTAGTYSGIYVETDGGCASQKIPDVFVLKDPTPPAKPVAGYNPPLCSGQPFTLTALSPGNNQPGNIEYVWAGPAFGALADTVPNAVVPFPSAALSDAGTYVVYAIQNNCISQTANFDVRINQSPSKPVIVTKTPLCVGQDLVLQAYSSIPGNATLNYLWKGPGAGFPVNLPNAGINNVAVKDGGIYSITVSSPQTGCSVTTDTLIQIGEKPVVVFARDTLILPTGSRLNLAPVITNAADPGVLPIQSYTWTPLQDLDCNDAICSSPLVTVKNNICYNVKVTNIYGCSGSDDVCINVFCKNSQVFIPNAFAPNGNVPENRILIVRASGIASVKSFRVFNRWGRLMFERSNFPPNSIEFGWDGRVNGKLADTGVYVYTVDVICENGVPYSFKGNVTLF
ncbi:PKD domain-containing protein [Chitinophaga sp. MM2321]|uniref:Ig-like domain-containing protein n=1 Tax=Chitinophaga sp. MM2321 TaxID=3137178 RepID=UPI0032D57F1B